MPILGLMGGDDPGIPVTESDRFRAALTEAGIESELVDVVIPSCK